jgi:hypothetical protein
MKIKTFPAPAATRLLLAPRVVMEIIGSRHRDDHERARHVNLSVKRAALPNSTTT